MPCHLKFEAKEGTQLDPEILRPEFHLPHHAVPYGALLRERGHERGAPALAECSQPPKRDATSTRVESNHCLFGKQGDFGHGENLLGVLERVPLCGLGGPSHPDP